MRGPRGVTTAMSGIEGGCRMKRVEKASADRCGVARDESGVVVEEKLRETETWPNRN